MQCSAAVASCSGVEGMDALLDGPAVGDGAEACMRSSGAMGEVPMDFRNLSRSSCDGEWVAGGGGCVASASASCAICSTSPSHEFESNAAAPSSCCAVSSGAASHAGSSSTSSRAAIGMLTASLSATSLMDGPLSLLAAGVRITLFDLRNGVGACAGSKA
eukprot:scaffold38512_cov28-Tisochrysis_lutea.AAC.1